ncbi:MAG: molybdate ABC transporter permease subunit [Leptospiraceae bacterium]|nr:molybdate ABC transporter permease subunit [Leptospiraceae bacterium]
MNLTQIEIDAIVLSLQIALYSIGIGLFPAITMAWLLSKKTFRGKIVLDASIHLPLVLPPVVIGYLLLIFLNRNSILGKILESMGIQLAFNRKGAVVAAMIMSFPLMVRAIRMSIDSIDSGLEDTARTLGASSLKVFFQITLPLSIPGIITACVLGFARTLGEFGATITFVSNIPGETQTLPLALYSFTQTPGGEIMAARLCVISILLSLVTLMVSQVLANRIDKRNSI